MRQAEDRESEIFCGPRYLQVLRREQRRMVLKARTIGNKMNFLKRLWQEEEGQDLVEYALLLVLVALAAVVGMQNLANAINSTFGTAATNLTTNT
jgi:pilus assembly protein Flp/PilA